MVFSKVGVQNIGKYWIKCWISNITDIIDNLKLTENIIWLE